MFKATAVLATILVGAAGCTEVELEGEALVAEEAALAADEVAADELAPAIGEPEVVERGGEVGTDDVNAGGFIGQSTVAVEDPVYCQSKWLLCAGATTGMIGACAAAAAASAGTLTFACAGLALTYTGACLSAFSNCTKQSSASSPTTIRSAGAVGEFPGTSTDYVCSTHTSVSRVTGLQVRAAYGIFGSGKIMNAIKLTCSSGQVLTFDAGSGGTGAAWETRNCGNGKMVQGFVFNVGGTAVDGINSICDAAGTSSGTDSTPTTTLGDGDVVTHTKKCAEGSYIYGMRMWKNTSGTKKFFQGLEPLCRTQW